GARRLAALKLLAKAGTIARDHGVPCLVIDDDAASEISLAENVQRAAMDVMDEVDAFAALVAEGMSIDDVARRFGATLRHVEQRLALARLSPKIKVAYRKGEVSLDAARAFCISDDPVQQETVFRQLAKPIVHAAGVRAHLTQGRVPANDRLAALVGVDAYEAAGGRVVRDLFEPDLVYLDDGDLLRRLAYEKAEGWRATLLAEGWGWIDINLGHARFEGIASERLHPSTRPLDAAERERLSQVEAEMAALEALLADAHDDDPRFVDLDRLDGDRDAIRDAARDWDPALMRHAGVVISLDHDGRPSFAKGVIKRADLKTIAKLRARAGVDPVAGAGGASTDKTTDKAPDPATSPPATGGPRLSRGLVEQLTGARTTALRAALAQHPHAALALLVHALGARSAGAAPTPGVDVVNRPHPANDAAPFDAARTALRDRWIDDPLTRLEALMQASVHDLLVALAVLVAETIDLRHAGTDADGPDRQNFADALAGALDLDMTAWWSPDLDFWMRCPKAFILGALADAPTIAAPAPEDRMARAAAFGRMTRAELAAAATQMLAGAGWLPDLLATPVRRGAFALTPEGQDAVEGLGVAGAAGAAGTPEMAQNLAGV
ncbi:MAG: hypothetical protein IV086_00305, partial [Hyphomonadaceae bacterium]|nr:hypothetical protein [Hyphomonadaceae bacterium]